MRSGFYEEKGRKGDNAGAGVFSKKGKRGVNKEVEQGETPRSKLILAAASEFLQ